MQAILISAQCIKRYSFDIVIQDGQTFLKRQCGKSSEKEDVLFREETFLQRSKSAYEMIHILSDPADTEFKSKFLAALKILCVECNRLAFGRMYNMWA